MCVGEGGQFWISVVRGRGKRIIFSNLVEQGGGVCVWLGRMQRYLK